MAVKVSAVKKFSNLKLLKETTILREHECTPECFKPKRKRTPPNLRRVSLGFIYASSDGRFYKPWGDGEWLSVEGVDFIRHQNGTLTRMFRPTEQLHIHSLGGRTGWKEVTSTQVRPDASFHAQQAATKLRKRGANLRDTQRFLAGEAAKVVPHAPRKRKPLKGTGRGAPGQPRSSFSKQVVTLRDRGMPECDVIDNMIKWLREHGETVTPLDRNGVKKRVHRWFSFGRKSRSTNRRLPSAPTVSMFKSRRSNCDAKEMNDGANIQLTQSTR